MKFNIRRLNTKEFRGLVKRLNKLELIEVRSYIAFQKSKAVIVWKNVKHKLGKDDLIEQDALLDHFYWSNKQRILIEEDNRRFNN